LCPPFRADTGFFRGLPEALVGCKYLQKGSVPATQRPHAHTNKKRKKRKRKKKKQKQHARSGDNMTNINESDR
jgi:hypothetical protein